MAVKWQYRSNSNTQAYYAAGLRSMLKLGSASAPTLTSGPLGTFGGTYLDMSASNQFIAWPGLDNVNVSSKAITILWRLIPVASGAPAATKGIFSFVNTANGWGSGAYGAAGGFNITTAGKLAVTFGSLTGTEAIFNAAAFGTTLTFVANQPTDIWFVWDGTTGTNKVELWQAQNGFSPTKIATLTAGTAAPTMLQGLVASMQTCDLSTETLNNNGFHYNEIVIFDTAETPSTYGARTDFIPTTAVGFEGYTATILGAADVRSGTIFGPGPGSLTGVAAIPSAANTRLGVSVDATTGTMIAAAAATTKTGIAADDGIGTLIPALKATTVTGTTANDGIGTVIPSLKATTVVGTTANDGTGQVIPALAATTEHGIQANDGLGTYRAHDLWSDPGHATVLSPDNGGPANYLADGVVMFGTLVPDSISPGAGNVIKPVSFRINGVDFIGEFEVASLMPSLISFLPNQSELLGSLPHSAELIGKMANTAQLTGRLDNQSELRGRIIENLN